ncbi:uncharacterized protein TNCV_609701 [Trichonephila clavipes]|nr:uncharacterized protein TNCV_609701 [Trichonephila clavipes]
MIINDSSVKRFWKDYATANRSYSGQRAIKSRYIQLHSSKSATSSRIDRSPSRLDPQVQDYVEVRNPQNTVQLLEVLSKCEERYSCKANRGSGNSDNDERRGWIERRMSNADDSRKNWRNSEVVRRPSNGRNQWFDSKNRFQKDDRRFNDRGYQFRNGGQKNDFSRGVGEIEVRVRILVEGIGGKEDD